MKTLPRLTVDNSSRNGILDHVSLFEEDSRVDLLVHDDERHLGLIAASMIGFLKRLVQDGNLS